MISSTSEENYVFLIFHECILAIQSKMISQESPYYQIIRQLSIYIFITIMNQSVSNLNKEFEKQLLELFYSIKIDKSKDSSVQKSTLISLLIYHHLDVQYPEFFRYILRSLQKLKKTNITEEEFLKIFINPDIDLGNSDKNELADAFSILDSKKAGSIGVEEFLAAYKMSQNYQKLSEQKKREAEDQIKQAFDSASEGGKITPMDFYHIVKFR